MLSTCPNCKKEIEHEDFLFEVQCQCGSRFNPFMSMSEETPAEVVATPVWENKDSTPDYSESQSVFSELKEFAETGAVTPPPSPPNATAELDSLPGATNSVEALDAILTAGDSLPGYQIDRYLPPVSAVAALDASEPNPLRPGFNALWSQALQCGANGIVAVRWVLSPDGTRVVLSGTPVHCSKDPLEN